MVGGGGLVGFELKFWAWPSLHVGSHTNHGLCKLIKLLGLLIITILYS